MNLIYTAIELEKWLKATGAEGEYSTISDLLNTEPYLDVTFIEGRVIATDTVFYTSCETTLNQEGEIIWEDWRAINE